MKDAVFRALASERRRRLLAALARHSPEDEIPVSEAVRSRSRGMDDFPIAMRHNHLPKLERWGFIRWNRDAGVVSRGPQFEEIVPLLTTLLNHDDDLAQEPA